METPSPSEKNFAAVSESVSRLSAAAAAVGENELSEDAERRGGGINDTAVGRGMRDLFRDGGQTVEEEWWEKSNEEC